MQVHEFIRLNVPHMCRRLHLITVKVQILYSGKALTGLQLHVCPLNAAIITMYKQLFKVAFTWLG